MQLKDKQRIVWAETCMMWRTAPDYEQVIPGHLKLILETAYIPAEGGPALEYRCLVSGKQIHALPYVNVPGRLLTVALILPEPVDFSTLSIDLYLIASDEEQGVTK